MIKPAILALEDGSVFHGQSIGADGLTSGEVVFNTAMTGYQEILTDPSYSRQIVTLTYPHIGNTGINDEDIESTRIQASGLVIRDLPRLVSNFRSVRSLDEYLRAQNVVGIADIDTRRLTRLLRDKGAQNGAILAGAEAEGDEAEERALAAAREFPGLKGMDLADQASVTDIADWHAGEWTLGAGHADFVGRERPWHVVAYDYGTKHNIFRMLTSRGCRLTIVPARTPASRVMELQPDGVFLANGPGDPEPCDYAIEAIREILETGTPVFGICLGHQLLALASGARTVKMRQGHHGANHPVLDLATGHVMITSQNHGFAADEATLPANVRATHRSLFDGTLQGIERTDCPAFSFQGHPEASPGPHDMALLFDRFVSMMAARRQAA
ncbi:glutamine-hydrolyzing carbamoyl-phosphate synthase small subunit [Kushneria phosphatilytica]|uniref:Carbamoyl phosphate synthase small chain n=1 Tax=Kushneria phosphatilytica TaxID=657387 RepID=A0A1S1NR19_9GAMM|nr:glutamine-hydrolyzing carbamoyl-phosphate synthase small subunit [Kushneria phosphatilytica]OHV11229.1 carbamoyl phosphate synthase small subunit [Kushneria phosphatilytica]QEL12198.1 glutamine-hydrolyzing carbamoyl-phosphate synthase small subunit [Kushneria phosphatilytica]